MFFQESNTNTLVVSDTLKRRYPALETTLTDNCAANQLKLVHADCKNLWARDWAPLQVGRRFIKFGYGYGKDNPQFPNLKVNPKGWNWLSTTPSRIRLDGGNVVRFGNRAIVTDIIYRHNPDYKNGSLVARLETLLQASITVVPTEPGDDIGHSDGICHFTPDGKLLVHDYRMTKTFAYRTYFHRLMRSLGDFECVMFPLAYRKRPRMTEKKFRIQFPEADTFNPGFGYYANFLVVGKLVFLPQFMVEEDDAAQELAKKHFKGYEVIPVMCSNLSMEGGLLNCIGMTYTL